ncbi:MAG TPA: hypothetical protein VD788_02535, partial [Candidatus Polarisedimenticolaceae bacterium]|nr:hypothetical protein [Candidatus Polarisedimenticolaceae bacterium]
GLSHLLAGQATDDHAILELEKSRLHVLPSGELCRDPLELLGSSLAELIKSLRERYDCILIDTPPLVLFPDADAIGVHSDGALVVARVGHTDVSSYKLAVDAVTSTRILGVILNDVSRRSFADWGKYRGGYANKDYYTSYYREGKDEGKDEE